jgi:hypothetical protein
MGRRKLTAEAQRDAEGAQSKDIPSLRKLRASAVNDLWLLD